MSSITGVLGGASSLSSRRISVRADNTFSVNGRVQFGQDSYTLSELRNKQDTSTLLLRFNYALGTLASAQEKLGELLGLTEDLVKLADKAALSTTSDSERNTLNRKFQKKASDFQKIIDQAEEEGVDFLDKKELSSVLEFAGVNTQSANKLAATFERLAGADLTLGFELVDGASTRYSRKVRNERPTQNAQLTSEATNGGTGITFAKLTDSTTNNVVLTTQATYTGNESGYAVTGTISDTNTLSLLSDISDENQLLLGSNTAGTVALVSTGDAEKAVLQFYIYTDPNQPPTLSETVATLDMAYDEVLADMSLDGQTYAYVSEDGMTLNYSQGGVDGTLSIGSGTISQLQVVNGSIFFTSSSVDLGSDGVNEDLYYIPTNEELIAPNRIAAGDYSDFNVATIESFTVSNNGTKVAFMLNEGADGAAITAGLNKELVILDLDSSEYSRFEDATGFTVNAPTGSTNDYSSFAFDADGQSIYVSQRELDDPLKNSIAEYDLTDITKPRFYDVQATGTFGRVSTIDSGSDFQLSNATYLDLNNDGNLDIVGSFQDSEGLVGFATYFGNGDETFDSVITSQFDTATSIGEVAFGDLDGDGIQDVFASTDGRILGFYKGSDSGTFSLARSFELDSISSIQVEDLNGDSFLDLVVARDLGDTSEVIYMDGEGNGSFSGGLTFVLTTEKVNDIQFGDLTGDGQLDIVTIGSVLGGTYTSSLVNVFVNQGVGSFAAPLSTEVLNGDSLATDATGLGVRVGDINRDGTLDIATISEQDGYSAVTVFMGQGDGTFGTGTSYATAMDVGADAQIELVDYNNNGPLDILVNTELSGSGRFYTIVANSAGDGGFRPPSGSTSVNTSDRFFAVGDVDNDGTVDLLQGGIDNGGGSGGQELNVRIADTTQTVVTGTFSTSASTLSQLSLNPPVGESGEIYVNQLIDINNDGELDLVSAGKITDDNNGGGSEGSLLSISLGNGDGTYGAAATSILTIGGAIRSIDLQDLDGDGNIDLVFGTEGTPDTLSGAGLFGVAMGKGDGTFATASTFEGLDDVYAVRLTDLTGDGLADLVIGGTESGAGEIRVMESNGDGTFKVGVSQIYSDEGVGVGALLSYDVDGDGDNDLISVGAGSDSEGYIGIRLNDGTGTLNSLNQYATDTYVDYTAMAAELGDLDRDGRIDVVVASTDSIAGSGSVAILSGAAAGSFTLAGTYLQESGETRSLDLVDLNRDGVLDIVTGGLTDSNSGETSVRFGVGDGTFTTRDTYQSGAGSVTGVFVKDVDANGSLELFAVQTPDMSGLEITMRASQTAAAGSILRTGTYTPEKIQGSNTAGLYGYMIDNNGTEEYFGVLSSAGFNKGSNVYGGANDALSLALTSEGALGGTGVLNPTIGGLSGADVLFSTTADYGGTNPDGLVGFTRQDYYDPGFEPTKVESSFNNQVLDVTGSGEFALVKDFTDDANVYSLKVYNISTGELAFDVGGYVNDSGALQNAAGAIVENGGVVNVAYTQEGNTSTLFFSSSTAPNTIQTLTLTSGSLDSSLASATDRFVFAANTRDYGGSGDQTDLYWTRSLDIQDGVTRVSLGVGIDVDADSFSVAQDGSRLATSDTDGNLYLISGSTEEVTATSLTNVVETALSADGTRLAVLQNDGGSLSVSLYRIRDNNELVLLDQSQLGSSVVAASSLSINGAGDQVGVVVTNSLGDQEFSKAIDASNPIAEVVGRTAVATIGQNGDFNALEQELSDLGYSRLASTTLQSLQKAISKDLKEITTVIDELADTIQKAFSNTSGPLRTLAVDRSPEEMKAIALEIANDLRGGSLETALLTNEIDPVTALELLK